MCRILVFFVFLCSFTKALAVDSSEFLKGEFQRSVGGISVSVDYGAAIEKAVLEATSNDSRFNSPQYLLVVDKNPQVQQVVLVRVDRPNKKITFIGAEKVSTGNPERRGFFETPSGFFENTPVHMSYRALGTKNSKGWRGLGAKGSRVWDFGWQETRTKRDEPYKIRLLLHATDPDFGEPRLGKVDSKGCVRISGKLNKFLDKFGILDASFEKEATRRYVLLKNRTPVEDAGKYMLVVKT